MRIILIFIDEVENRSHIAFNTGLKTGMKENEDERVKRYEDEMMPRKGTKC